MFIFAVTDIVIVKGIPVYRELSEIHEATGSLLRVTNPAFHCFNMGDISREMRSLRPYRCDFFTLALSFGSRNFSININDHSFNDLEKFLICVAPGQVSSFKKEGEWAGFCTFFKAEFMQYKSGLNFLDDYPFFNIQETNLFPVTAEQFNSLSLHYRQILEEQQKGEAYHAEVIRCSFQAILWQVRRTYESVKVKQVSDKAAIVIASKFQYLVNQFFTSRIFVEEYAEMLSISPNHLTQTIKEATGKTAKSIISQRRAEEAKYLLKYTHEDISTISYHLHFSEPTHFNKFFKKASGYTPLNYRMQFTNA
jgi:AraC-like DNA-binding protein